MPHRRGRRKTAGWREMARSGQDDAERLLFLRSNVRAAEGEGWVIGADCRGSHKDGIGTDAQLHGIGAGGFRGEPLALAGRAGNAAVEADSCLGDDPRQARGDELGEGGQQISAGFPEDTSGNRHAGFPEHGGSPSRMARIGIVGPPHDPGKARADEGVGTRWRAAGGRAWFQRDVGRGPADRISSM